MSQQDVGAHLPPCNKIVRVNPVAGITIELLPCGGGLIGMSIDTVQRYCHKYFNEEQSCSGYHRMHGQALAVGGPEAASEVLLVTIPFSAMPVAARMAYRGPAVTGTGTPADVTHTHMYEDGSVVLLANSTWYQPEDLALPPITVQRQHVYPDGQVAYYTQLPWAQAPEWVMASDLGVAPQSRQDLARSEAAAELAAAATVAAAAPTAASGTGQQQLGQTASKGTFEDLLMSITGGAEPIVLKKPDVSEILSTMPGMQGGSSLSWGVNVHILIDWLQCRRRVYLAHVRGIRSRFPRPHFQIGTLYHAALHFAKTYGLDRADDPLAFVEEHAGAGVLGEEMSVARAVLRARLKRYGYLDYGPSSNVITSEIRMEAVSAPVKIPGKTGSFRIRLCGRLDDVRRTSEGKAIVHDEKTASMLTRELTEGFGLDFQLMGYAGLYVMGGGMSGIAGEPKPELASTMVTIGVKPDVHVGGVKAVDPDRGIVRVESPIDLRDVRNTWEYMLVPAATDLLRGLVAWERGKDLPPVDLAWPRCTPNCVGRWGRCDYFDLCSRHFDSVRGVEDRYEEQEHRQVRVLQKGAPYLEKVTKASTALSGQSGPASTHGDALAPAPAAASTAALKAQGAETLGRILLQSFRELFQTMSNPGIAEERGVRFPDWFNEPEEDFVEQLFRGDAGQGVDEAIARRAATGILKALLVHEAIGSKEKPNTDGEAGLLYVLLGGDTESGRPKSPIVAYEGPNPKWAAVSQKSIVDAMLKHLFEIGGTGETAASEPS